MNWIQYEIPLRKRSLIKIEQNIGDHNVWMIFLCYQVWSRCVDDNPVVSNVITVVDDISVVSDVITVVDDNPVVSHVITVADDISEVSVVLPTRLTYILFIEKNVC